MKLTNIFPAHIKPVRKGVYKVSIEPKGKLTHWAYWTGSLWGYAYWFHQNAYKHKSNYQHSANQDKRWQGLATKDGK